MEIDLGPDRLGLIAGPCVLEGRDFTLRHAEAVARIGRSLGLEPIFKGSFDKANRTSGSAARGPGLDEGLRWLQEARELTGLAVTTDVHLPDQAQAVAQAVDLLQIPAFLCRQTDLLVACGRTGKPVNLKKGQFVAPWDLGPAIAKIRSGGSTVVALTERGTTFGHGDLVVDMRGIPAMKALGVPVIIDATHSAQRPGALGDRSGGDREVVPTLALAGIAAGADALFVEVHEDPERAWSDAATQWPIQRLEGLLRTAVAVWGAVRG